MVFCPDWDTARGTPKATATFARNAEAWMKEHLPRPGEGYELHVDKTPQHRNGYFGPGGIRWIKKMDCHHKMELAEAVQIVEEYGGTIDW